MKKSLIGVFLLLLVVSPFVSAGEQLTISLDGSNMGAVVRVLDPSSEALLENAKMKNYNTGVVTADYESTRSKVVFKILVTKGGSLFDSWQSDPLPTDVAHEFDFRKSAPSVLVDTSAPVEEEVLVPVASNDTNNTANKTNVGGENNTSNNSVVDVPKDNVVPEVKQEESPAADTVSLTGNAVGDLFSPANRWYVVIGIIGLLALFSVTGLFLHRRKKKQPAPHDERTSDELELERLESKLRDNEVRIKKIKKRDDTKRRIDEAKKRLAREEDELRNLEGGSRGNKDNQLWGTK